MIGQIAAFFLTVMISSSVAMAEVDPNVQVNISSKFVLMNPNDQLTLGTVIPVNSVGDTLPTSVHEIPPYSALSLDGNIIGLESGFTGSIRVQADQPLVGVLLNNISNSLGEIIGRSGSSLRGSSELTKQSYLPYLPNSNGLKSHIAVQNCGNINTDITLHYYALTQVSSQKILSLPPGAGRILDLPYGYDYSGVITSSNTPVSTHVEILHYKNFIPDSSYSYSGTPDNELEVQAFQPFINNYLNGPLTSLALMNASDETKDGVALFKGDADPSWDLQDFPGILPFHSITAMPPDGATWKIGLALLSSLPKQASIAHTRDDFLSTSYASPTSPSPVPQSFEWYIAALNNLTEINLYHDHHAPVDYTITYKYGTTEVTNNLNLEAWGRVKITPPLPPDTEGSAIIKNLSAFPTGLSIEVKDKSNPADVSVYSPARAVSMLLFLPWFTYQYSILERPLTTSILFQIIPVLAAANKKQTEQVVLKTSGPE